MNFKLNRIGTAWKIVLVFIFFAAGYRTFAAAEYVKVVDGDSLEIGKKRVRLLEIDAPEYKQYCFDKHKQKYDCGKLSRRFLDDMLKRNGYKLKCHSRETDRYGRDLAECYVGGKNLNLEMIKAGWAVTYRTENPLYLSAEEQAKKGKKGVWQGKLMRPEYYRRLHRR